MGICFGRESKPLDIATSSATCSTTASSSSMGHAVHERPEPRLRGVDALRRHHSEPCLSNQEFSFPFSRAVRVQEDDGKAVVRRPAYGAEKQVGRYSWLVRVHISLFWCSASCATKRMKPRF